MNSKSENFIKSIDYDSSKQALYIKIDNNEVLYYEEVPQLVYQGLLNSASKADYIDDYLNKNCKGIRIHKKN